MLEKIETLKDSGIYRTRELFTRDYYNSQKCGIIYSNRIHYFLVLLGENNLGVKINLSVRNRTENSNY